jgi:hypothetical protein
MATGAANMRTLARQLEQVPDQAVAELVRWFVPRSEAVGGKMRWFNRVVQLSSRLRTPRRGRGSSSVIVHGSPASCWSIKSYGRKGGYTVRPTRRKALHLGALSNVFFAEVHIGRGTNGDRRWDRLVTEADQKFPDVVADVVSKRVSF